MKVKIEADIPDRWVNTFCSFLKDMENNGNLGHTARMLFISDGDGDFRPKFNIDMQYEKVKPFQETDFIDGWFTPLITDVYDAR